MPTVEERRRAWPAPSTWAIASWRRQLVSGFYGIETGAWRWTGKQFAVALGTPAGAAQKGAVLELKLTVPPVTIEKLKR